MVPKVLVPMCPSRSLTSVVAVYCLVASWLCRKARLDPDASMHKITLALVEFGRALVSRDHRQADPARRIPQVPELITAIEDYMSNHNQNPRVFVWTASVESILTKIAKCKEALDALH
jgi:hypothetical protein